MHTVNDHAGQQVEWSRVRDQTAAYYDRFVRQLLYDLAHGNPRIEAAIRYAIRASSPSAKRVLDIGCGLGWSSYELARHLTGAEVDAVDLSQQLVRHASDLWQMERLSFQVRDVCANEPADADAGYDTAVMLDVYEHIPRAERAAFHTRLQTLLAPDARMILTCPTPRHQAFLRQEHREGLQPVDEDVTRDDLEQMAKDLGLQLADYREVSIFTENDYFHATLAGQSFELQSESAVSLTPKDQRQKLLETRLGIQPVSRDFAVSRRGERSVCVIQLRDPMPPESFVVAHMERLPARIRRIQVRGIPDRIDDSSPLLEEDRLSRVKRLIRRRFLKTSLTEMAEEATARFLRQAGIAAVLAEYGMNGCAVMRACERAGVPLVVHFHGHDATRRSALEDFGESYKTLFSIAAAIIAVSQPMKEQLIQLGAPPSKVHINIYGVDCNAFHVTDPGQNEAVFVATGRFVDKKAPHLTLEAFRQVVAEAPEARLRMIGDGYLLDSCRRLARAFGLEQQVTFLGRQPHEVVAAEMYRARAFVQHSVVADDGDSEGTPVAVLEAGACGLPVVATRHAGIPGVVEHGSTGMLVEEGDVATMAEHMLSLVQKPQWATRLGDAAQRHVREHHSMDKSIAGLWSIIEQAIAGRPTTTEPLPVM